MVVALVNTENLEVEKYAKKVTIINYIIFALVGLFFVTGGSLYIQKRLKKISKSLLASAELVTTGTKEITKGNQDLSSRTQEQASSLEETASTMEEITSTVKQTADNSLKATDLAKQAVNNTLSGTSVSEQAKKAMIEISTSSTKISEIVNLVNEMAFQTNILAINAAIEAAKAGEASPLLQ